MKRCPTCQKEFADSMRFCQTDGTPLVDTAEAAPPDDPFKTIVGQSPPDDPFKTVVGSSSADQSKDNDILQLPEEPLDPMKTMVVSPEDWKKGESSASTSEPPMPEPPKFNEPNLNPPVFGDLSPQPPSSTGDIFGSSGSSSSAPPPPPEPPREPKSSDSPFGQPPTGSPFQSPFEQQKSSFEPPSPFDQPAPQTPFDAPKPPPFKEPEAPFGNQPSPFDQSPFGQPQSPAQAGSEFGDPFSNPQPQTEWNPPPVPVQNWQDQQLGANTPFQPPPAGAGQNQTLPIISLILGIVSLCCYISPVTGLAALITGFLGMKNANQDPANYGGKTLAIVGMVLGGIFFLVGIAYYIFWLLLGASAFIPR
jgi:hypothetical protein